MVAPRAVASSWWPRQIPNTGTVPASTRVRISATMPGTAAGSPGPLDKKMPSGSRASTSSAGVEAGTTVTVARSPSWRSMASLMPKS